MTAFNLDMKSSFEYSDVTFTRNRRTCHNCGDQPVKIRKADYIRKMGIPEYFDSKTILVTGATGFMGKALVEKLLRSCPGISKIYVVIRSKKGTSPNERWERIAKLPLFDKLKSEQPDALTKVVPIPGEGSAENYGISPENEKILIDNVNVVYHVAASVNFAEDFVTAVIVNVKSLYYVLEMAKKMKNLECFVHTSTAFSNMEKLGEVQERVYESPLDWKTMLKLTESSQNKDTIPIIQPMLMSGHKLTYTLTKQIAESLAKDYSQYFPVVVMRPALVLATMEDPIPDWLDVHNALSLLADAVRTGAVRVINTDRAKALPLIPLDLSVRAFIIAVWNVHRKKMKTGSDVYCTSLTKGGAEGVNLSWDEFSKRYNDTFQKYPAVRQMWHPLVFQVRNDFIFTVFFYLFQLIPALLGDLLCISRGIKPKFSYLTMKFYNVLTVTLKCATGRFFYFSVDNYRNLDNILDHKDRKAFSIDQSNVTADRLWDSNRVGIMKYVLREDMSPEALEKRRKRSRMFRIAHYVACTVGVAITGFVMLKVARALCG